MAAPAFGQAQDVGSRTVVGGAGHSVACSSAARRAETSDAAIGACNAALLDPLQADQRLALLVNRGAIRARRQERTLALADFDAALAIEPRNPVALLNRGMVLVQLRQSGPAVAALTQALSFGVSAPYLAYYYRGVARERLGDVRGAYEDYSTALDIQPNWAPAEEEMARFARGRRQELASQIDDAPRPR
jgi:tetratricopeptide (TPR) repeat protein